MMKRIGTTAIPLAILILSSIGPTRTAAQQSVDHHFQVLMLDQRMADALQERLITGGQAAVDAMARMPEFVSQGRARLEAEVKAQAGPGQRVEANSGDKMLEIDRRVRDLGQRLEVAEGLDVDFETNRNKTGDLADLRLASSFARRITGGVKVSHLHVGLTIKIGEPTLLARWQEADEIRLFTLVLTASNAVPGDTVLPPRIYFDTAIYESAADLEAARNPVARTVFSCRSGQKAQADILVPFLYELEKDVWETCDLGFTAELEPALTKSGEVDFRLALSHNTKGSGRERLASGNRVPKIDFRESKAKQFRLTDGKTEVIDVTIHGMTDSNPKPDSWKAIVKCHLTGP